jgi:hypothetical protein
MNFIDVSFVGATLDDGSIADLALIDQLPSALQDVLRQVNGLVAFRGGFHLRGAVSAPPWHSLRLALEGPDAIHALFPAVRATDIPFAQDALGEQFLLRDEQVWRLSAEVNELEPLGQSLGEFLEEISFDPDSLGLQPLLRFESEGGSLAPGQLLSVYPPYVMDTKSPQERSFRAVAMQDRLRFLSQLAAHVSGLPDGAPVRLEITPPEV